MSMCHLSTTNRVNAKAGRLVSGTVALLLTCLGGSAQALTVSSTGFQFDSLTDFDLVTPSVGPSDNRLGTFSFGPVPSLVGYYLTSASITFTARDGDTGPGESDVNDLALGLGPGGGGSVTRVTPVLLNGFLNGVNSTATNSATFLEGDLLGSEITSLLAGSGGSLLFYLVDLDEGGNRIGFRIQDAPNFSLTLNFAQSTPVPVPAAALLLLSGLGAVGFTMRRRR